MHEHRRNAAAYDHESPTLCDSVNSGANLLPGSPVQSVLMPWQLTEAGLRSYGSSTARPYIYPCPECGRPFTRKQHVRRHLEVHKRKRRTTASDSVRADRQLSDSVRSKVVPPRCRFVRFATKPRLHPCPECGKSFTRKQHVRRHLQVHETQADGTAFDSVDASENTQSCDSVRSDVNLLPCDLADSGTRSLLHDSTSCEVMSLPYDSADFTLPCDLADFGMKSLRNDSADFGEKSSPFYFADSEVNLQRCDTLHSLRNPIPLATVKLRTSLRPTVRPRSHACPECGRSFTRKQHMRSHLQVHKRKRHTIASDFVHADTLTPSRCRFVRFATRPRLHPCPMCGKSFTRRQHVQRHLQVHGHQNDATAFDAVHTSENMQYCDPVRCAVNHSSCDLADSTVKLPPYDSANSGVKSPPCDSGDSVVKSLPCGSADSGVKSPLCDSADSGVKSLSHDSADSEVKSSTYDSADAEMKSSLRDSADAGVNLPHSDRAVNSLPSTAVQFHTSVHSSVRPRLRACPEGRKSFARKQYLRRHFQVNKHQTHTSTSDSVHSGVIPPRCRFVRFAARPRLHPCPECGKSFTRKQHVRRHLKAHEHWKGATALNSVHSSENMQSSDVVHSDKNPLPFYSARAEVKLATSDLADVGVTLLSRGSADSGVKSAIQNVANDQLKLPCDLADSGVKLSPCNLADFGMKSSPHDLADAQLKSLPCDSADSRVNLTAVNPLPSAAVKRGTSDRSTVRTRLHACPECGKSFMQKHLLRRHLKVDRRKKHMIPFDSVHADRQACDTVHFGVTLPRCRAVRFAARPRLHPCPECGKSFTRKQHVRRHVQAYKHWRNATTLDSAHSSENTQSSDNAHSDVNLLCWDLADAGTKPLTSGLADFGVTSLPGSSDDAGVTLSTCDLADAELESPPFDSADADFKQSPSDSAEAEVKSLPQYSAHSRVKSLTHDSPSSEVKSVTCDPADSGVKSGETLPCDSADVKVKSLPRDSDDSRVNYSHCDTAANHLPLTAAKLLTSARSAVRLPVHACPECGKGFMQRHLLRRHLQVDKREKHTIPCDSLDSGVIPRRCRAVRFAAKPRLHPCPECGKSFTREQHVRRHLQAYEHSKDTPAFASVNSSENVQSYNSDHSGVNPLSYDLADSEMKSSAFDVANCGMKLLPYDSADSGLKSTPCEINSPHCDPVHSLVDPLLSTDAKRRSSVMSTVMPRLCVCPECGKSYTRKQHLQRHLEVHKHKKLTIPFEPGVTPPRCRPVRFAARPRLHPCPECGKSFTRKQHVQRHLQAHEHWKDESTFDSVQFSENMQLCDSVYSDVNPLPSD